MCMGYRCARREVPLFYSLSPYSTCLCSPTRKQMCRRVSPSLRKPRTPHRCFSHRAKAGVVNARRPTAFVRKTWTHVTPGQQQAPPSGPCATSFTVRHGAWCRQGLPSKMTRVQGCGDNALPSTLHAAGGSDRNRERCAIMCVGLRQRTCWQAWCHARSPTQILICVARWTRIATSQFQASVFWWTEFRVLCIMLRCWLRWLLHQTGTRGLAE